MDLVREQKRLRVPALVQSNVLVSLRGRVVCELSYTQLQAVVHGTYSLLDNIGAWPVSKELAARVQEEKKHMADKAGTLGFGLGGCRPVVPSGPFKCALVQWGHPLNPLLHLLHVVNKGEE